MMKVIKGIIFVLIIMVVVGCDKKSPTILLCDDVEPIVNEHMDNKNSYNDFIYKLKIQYNKHCNEEKNDICSAMGLMIDTHKKYENNEEDCNKFGEGTYKQMCESNREMHYDLVNKKTEVEFIRTLCNRERKK